MPPGTPGLNALAHHARGGERLAQDKIGERLASEVAAEVEAAASQAGHRPGWVLLVAGQREAALECVVPAGPRDVSRVIELVGNVALAVKVAIAKRGESDVGEGQGGRALKL